MFVIYFCHTYCRFFKSLLFLQTCSECDSSDKQVKTQKCVFLQNAWSSQSDLIPSPSPSHLVPLTLLPWGTNGWACRRDEQRGPLASPILWFGKKGGKKHQKEWWVDLTLLGQCSGEEKWGKYQWRWSHIAHLSMSEISKEQPPGFAPPLSSCWIVPMQK